MRRKTLYLFVFLFLPASLLTFGGCVRRTITITSDPEGALVFLNDQEIGRTPVEVDFLYYGEYDVRLVHEDYEPIATSATATPPIWDNIPLDLIAEAVPGEPHAQIHWHYELQPPRNDPQKLVERAMDLREAVDTSQESDQAME